MPRLPQGMLLCNASMSRYTFAALAIGLIIAAYLTVLYLAQRSLLFPAPLDPPPPLGRAELVRLPLAGGEAQALFLAPVSASGPAPLLIFMHGNAELADYWQDAFDEITNAGFAALLLEYPGYGRSAGRPSERSINEAAHAAYDWALADPRINPKRIIPYGRSLGGGPATRLAVDRKTPALILESSFTSVAAFARQFLAPAFLIRDKFDNLTALQDYRGQLLVIHGNRDQIIPYSHGEMLARVVPDSQFLELKCGHNDCPRSWRQIQRFLAELDLPR